MKLSLRFATFSLLLAAVAALEASPLYDTAVLKRQSVPAHSYDHARPRKHSHSAHVRPSVKQAQSPPQHSPSGRLTHGYGTSETIKPANAGRCHSVGATAKITTVSGPNGHIDWLNCGIHGSGWSPAPVKVEDLVVVPLDSARHTTFSPCSDKIIATFKKYGQHLGIPPIILASFAMQESSCNPSAVGGAGEQGLMQITRDKCKGAPNGNCKDIDFNIRTGAEFFAATLASNGGDVFSTIGEYNGWKPGMTYGDATRAAHTCCRCQNNLDYLHQFLNGWIQGLNAYEMRLGKYHNVDCPK